MLVSNETIAAIATAPGRGGVGIIRISGPKAFTIAANIIPHKNLKPREVIFSAFYDADHTILDEGIVLPFKAPNSFTGEDVIELQGHGGPIILDILLKRVLSLGARLARPGEFSERAFLNDKLDLAQAEAIADLIDASSEQAARSALRSLTGVFSEKINTLVEALIHLRIYVEAAIDFPDEEIDFLSDGHVEKEIRKILNQLDDVQAQAKQGAILRDGIHVVIAGKPNAGKSSLLNALAGFEAAIVTDIPGTTRDVLREKIQIDGIPLHIVDTAGLRETADIVEQEGVRRARSEIEKADVILFVYDSSTEKNPLALAREYFNPLPAAEKFIMVANKIDLSHENNAAKNSHENEYTEIRLSAKNKLGLEYLREHLKLVVGVQNTEAGLFSARRRHLDALDHAHTYVDKALVQLLENNAGELVAEDLRQAQHYLSEITGEFSSDDLLGRIFSSFCIGK